ncbi:hypothetical protein [Streptomyces sp. NPDC048603]|uniref:hypothetical protein n=1 Tax=Streptomyces sp. NPDC048603 TaxID=3365577 RepID=UPI003717DDEB
MASITPGPGNTGPSSAPAPSPTTAEPIPTPSPTQSEPACSKFEKMSDREFKLLAKNPYEHLGKCYRIYGYVTQADSATGSLSVRANACGEKHQPTYGFISDCDTNSFFTELGGGDGESGIDNIVDGDAFEADVEVGVPYTYTTTLGGQMTAPKFHLHKITKYATTK